MRFRNVETWLEGYDKLFRRVFSFLEGLARLSNDD